jgi:uncharacterized protein (TIGR02118 family)
MIKLLALYKKPADAAAFFKHYNEVHIPLVEKIPGLKKVIVSRVTGTPMGGEAPYFLIAEMQFADKPAFEAAAASPEFRATGEDVGQLAKGLVTLMIAESD